MTEDKIKLDGEREGDCYKANFNLLLELNDNTIRRRLISSKKGVPILCHGIVKGDKGSPVEGIKFGHCWIEISDRYIDNSNGKIIVTDKRPLYKDKRILPNTVKRYSFSQAIKQCNKFKHYGPWNDYNYDNEVHELMVKTTPIEILDKITHTSESQKQRMRNWFEMHPKQRRKKNENNNIRKT